MPSEKKTDDSEVCGLQYGAKTAATSMVAHLVQKHEISVPEYLTEKASQLLRETTLCEKHVCSDIRSHCCSEGIDRGSLLHESECSVFHP